MLNTRRNLASVSFISIFAGQYGAGNTITFQKGKSKASKVSKENRKHFDDSKSQLGYRKFIFYNTGA